MLEEAFIKSAKTALEKEAKAVLKLSDRIGESFVKAVNTILSHKGKLVICGVGKSGLIGQKIAATMSSTGTSALFLHACDAVHGDMGIYEAGDPTILISNSGSTEECLRLMPLLKQFNSPIIAIVGRIDSPMAKQADIVLDASCDGEADPLGIVPTSSTTVALAWGDALACALITARNFTKIDFAKFHPAGQLGRTLLLKVKDVMHPVKECAVAKAHDLLKETVVKMTENPLGAACIVDDCGGLAGLITDGDIRRAFKCDCDFNKIQCADIMTKKPVSILPEASLGQAVALMEERPSNKRLSVLPVVDNSGKFAGIIRLHDIYQPKR